MKKKYITYISDKFANFILKTILKLNDDDLMALFIFIDDELQKRGIYSVRSCREFFN